MIFQICWEKGHNIKTCTKEPQPKPIKEKRKPRRKNAGASFLFPSGEAANDDDDTGVDESGEAGAGPSNVAVDDIIVDESGAAGAGSSYVEVWFLLVFTTYYSVVMINTNSL